MTEAQFQATRKMMQSANFIRGEITRAKGEVAKWTAIEDGHRRNLKTAQADAAKKQIEKAIQQLDKVRKRFTDLKLPGEDAKSPTFWIAAICNDSFNYFPKELPDDKRKEAVDEGFVIHETNASAQNECDSLNSL